MPRKRKKLASRVELAAVLGINPITVTKWQREGLPVSVRGGRGRPSKYDVDEVRAWVKARSEAAEAKTSGPLDPQQERAAKDHWQAVLAEQKYLVQQGKLLDAELVERARVAEIARTRAKVLAIPTAWPDRIFRAATLDGLSGVQRALQEVCRELLRELAAPPISPGSPEAQDELDDDEHPGEAA